MKKANNNVLINGDCIHEMSNIESNSVDMVLVDPPYGTTACKWDSVIPLDPMWEHLKRIIKHNGAIVMTASQPFTTMLISSNIKMFKLTMVWRKNKGTGFLNSKRRPLVYHEDIVVFYNKQPTYNPQMTKGMSRSNGATKRVESELYGKNIVTKYNGSTDRYPSSVIDIPVLNNQSSDRVHPTQKPVELMQYLIRTYTNEGDTVLDFAMGSGTTGVACANERRRFIGMELDPDYFKISEDRICNACC